MCNNKGFISTSVIYAIFIVFLLMLTTLFLYYFNSRMLLTEYKSELKDYLIENNSFSDSDIIVNFYLKNDLGNYDYVDEVISGYDINTGASECMYVSGTKISDVDIDFNKNSLEYTLLFDIGDITNEQIICYLYFDKE